MTPTGKSESRPNRGRARGGLVAVPKSMRPVGIPRTKRTLTAALEIAVLAASDLVALLVATAIAYGIWAFMQLGQPPVIYERILPFIALFPLVYAAFGLYPGFGLGAPEVIRRLASATSLGYVVLAGATFAIKLPQEYSRATFAIAWLLSLALLPLMRFFALTVARKFSWWGEPTVVIGNPAQVELTMDMLREAKSLGYRVVGVLCSDPEVHGSTIDGVPVLGGHDLSPLVGAAGVDTALVWGGVRSVDTQRASGAQQEQGFDWLQRHFRHVIVLHGDDGLPVEHVRIRNLGVVLGVEYTNELLRPENRVVKRALDIVLGAILLTLAAPVILICGLMVKMVSRGPIFYAQEREGLDGRKIKMWKLRTMYVDAEDRLAHFLDRNPNLRSEWEANYKLAYDPRVVRGIGRILRRFSLDELPQLYCVVIGTMSLVGPRPLPDYHLQVFPREFLELRRRVRPGITGMWQVTVRNQGGMREHERYDSYYIRNWSVWLDMYVLGKTTFAVLAAKGAF